MLSMGLTYLTFFSEVVRFPIVCEGILCLSQDFEFSCESRGHKVVFSQLVACLTGLLELEKAVFGRVEASKYWLQIFTLGRVSIPTGNNHSFSPLPTTQQWHCWEGLHYKRLLKRELTHLNI